MNYARIEKNAALLDEVNAIHPLPRPNLYEAMRDGTVIGPMEATFPSLPSDDEEKQAGTNGDGRGLTEKVAHPLAQFVDFDTKPRAVKWMIPGLIQHGFVTISGARGVGKTTCILPLAMTVAGLHAPDYPLAPKHWRHVIYVAEDAAQVQRILSGMVQHSDSGIKPDDVRERLHLVEARRLRPSEVAKVGELYRERFTRVVNGVELLPLVVLDTKSAVLALENENDNSEASAAVAALRQGFSGLPIWTVGHISKSQFGRTDVDALSDRGAGSFEGDAEQNVYLVKDDKTGARHMLLGKRRFEPRWTELQVHSHTAMSVAHDEWGDPETTILRWGILTPPDMSRTEARERAQAAAELSRAGELRQAILDRVQVAWQTGNPINKTGVKSAVHGFKNEDVLRGVDLLIAEGWLHEIEVPKAQRTNNRKTHFLIKLDTEEHDEFRQSGTVPAAKLVIPQSWRKPEFRSSPIQDQSLPEKGVLSPPCP